MAEEVKQKRGFFSKLFFEEKSEETTKTAPEDDIKVSNTAAQNGSAVIESLNIPITGDGIFDKRFSDALQQAIAENNIQGIDYFEFSQALKSMSGAGLNEAIGFQTIFTTLKVGDASFTKEKLLSSIDHYVGVLKKEEQEFKNELLAKTEQDVTSRRNRVASLNSENQELLMQIQSINEKIAKNQEEALALNSEASNSEAVIGQTNKNFITTLAHVVSGLETDKLKIGQLIKE
ncbi:MAG: hypothetical protein AABY15_05340 [Nanoarchaeota archaeon]